MPEVVTRHPAMLQQLDYIANVHEEMISGGALLPKAKNFKTEVQLR
jgi:hypothetical protein